MKRLIKASLLCTLLTFLVSSKAGAQFIGTDDFNSALPDTSKWTVNGYQKNPGDTLVQGSGNLSYSVSAIPGSGSDAAAWLWNAQAPSNADWSATLDVANLSSVSNSFVNIGLVARDAADLNNVGFGNRLDIADSGLGTVINWEAEIDTALSSPLYQSSTLTTSGSLLLTYNATTQTLTAAFDEDGATGGYVWTSFASTTLTELGMSPTDGFIIGISGNSDNMLVNGSNGVSADNFALIAATTPITFVVPEPSSLGYLLAGLLLLAGGLFRKRCAA